MLNLIRYIDRNALDAGITKSGTDYPYSSAFHYRHGSAPPWLKRDMIEGVVRRMTGAARFHGAAYAECFDHDLGDAGRSFIEERIRRGGSQDDPLDDLVGAAPARVCDWMKRKAVVADGCGPSPVLVAPAIIDRCCRSGQSDGIRWTYREKRVAHDVHEIARVALLRDASAASWAEVAERVGFSEWKARDFHRIHRKLLGINESYANRIGALLASAIEQQFGPIDSRR